MHQAGFTTLLKGNLSGIHVPCVSNIFRYMLIFHLQNVQNSSNLISSQFSFFLLNFHANNAQKGRTH